MENINSKYKITSDTMLWNNFRAGDKKSFENIYKIYINTLYQYGSKFTSDKELVFDCIHDVFVDLFTHRKNLGETNNIKLYIFICLKRTLIRSLRRKKMVQSFADSDIAFLSTCSSEEEVSDQESDMEMANKISKAMETLSPHQKEAVYLRFVCGLKFEEICLILDINYQSVRNLIYRAIKKLRKIMFCSFFHILLLFKIMDLSLF
ncbi:MAG: sigma-70 family RNA polymerase sigma factor [Bacteroidia bacterium]|nr:sigma-70 family RNA polymerase sigma factor [Bacteroidia bacterium]